MREHPAVGAVQVPRRGRRLLMRLRRLPIPVPPARHEVVGSYLVRLANLHGLDADELWHQVSVARPTAKRRTLVTERLTELTGHPPGHLAGALPELRDPAPDWRVWRHAAQTGCPRCAAHHPGGRVFRLLPHHRYVCVRHRYWIGPPDFNRPCPALDGLPEIVTAQRRHRRLLRRHGWAATYDAVLTGFMICGHLWSQPEHAGDLYDQWEHRARILIPPGREHLTFSAPRLFAAIYPEAVNLAVVLGSPTWRRRVAGNAEEQRQFTTEIGRRIGQPHYQPRVTQDAIAHWIESDSQRPPSPPPTTFPDTHSQRPSRLTKISENSLERHANSTRWFMRNRQAGTVILHHRHVHPVLVREWSPDRALFASVIWASQTTTAGAQKPPSNSGQLHTRTSRTT